jgi:hypothetical protein
METLRDVVSVQFVTACIGTALVLVEIFRQGGRYNIRRVCGIGLAASLLLTLGSAPLGHGSPFLRAMALSLLSFFGGYFTGAILVFLYIVGVFGIAGIIIIVFHGYRWCSRRWHREKSRIPVR